MAIHPDLLAILCCPKCHGRVEERAKDGAAELVCPACRLAFPVVGEVPNFLLEEARSLDEGRP